METAVVSDSPRKAGYFTPMILSELASDVNAAAANWPLMVWRYLPSKIIGRCPSPVRGRQRPEGEEFARSDREHRGRLRQSTDPVTCSKRSCDMAAMFRTITPVAFNLDDAGHARQYRRWLPPDPDALQIPIDPVVDHRADDGRSRSRTPRTPSRWRPRPRGIQHIMEVLAAAVSPETLIKIQYVMPPSEGDDRARAAHGRSHRAMPTRRLQGRGGRGL